MAAIKAKNTRPEILIRKALHKEGFRFRLHKKELAGKPDLVFPKHQAVIFINGCFWHGHECSMFHWPKTRMEFWQEKIMGNRKRDAQNLRQLRKLNWRIALVWECALTGKHKLGIDEVTKSLSGWLLSEKREITIDATDPG